ncbi:MAG: Nitrogen regulation protein ntrY [Acidobacteria bacterium]|nr:Nitrogen regulation protein ntrY [Acidobacteriota bacterium]
MSSRAALAVLVALTLGSLLAFSYVLRQLSLASVALPAHEEVEQQLRRSLQDQKTLARLDPSSASRYHRRFDSTVTLLGHLRVVQFNRREMARQVEELLLGAVALILSSGLAIYLVERRNREGRLVRLERALVSLSRGEGDIRIGERRRDVIGRIAAAVETSSREAARDRTRLRYLEHLSAWQEAARRHAHEMRTPLTAARMDVERFVSVMHQQLPHAAAEIDEARRSILEELDSLREFTRRFTSFATIARPRPRAMDLRRLVADLCSTFANAWPNLRLIPESESGQPAMVNADGEMLRQVLVNLAGNSALAAATTITFHLLREGAAWLLDVSDDGRGMAPEIRAHLFEPYTTSRSIGEGMGLGLAISKKIMLDHGGDLDLLQSSAAGVTFRLTLPSLESLS